MRLCKCGCGKEVKGATKEYAQGHSWRDPNRPPKRTVSDWNEVWSALSTEPKLCACGCGNAINPKKKFARGHIYKGRVRESMLGDLNPMKNEATRDKIRETLKGRRKVDGHFVHPAVAHALGEQEVVTVDG